MKTISEMYLWTWKFPLHLGVVRIWISSSDSDSRSEDQTGFELAEVDALSKLLLLGSVFDATVKLLAFKKVRVYWTHAAICYCTLQDIGLIVSPCQTLSSSVADVAKLVNKTLADVHQVDRVCTSNDLALCSVASCESVHACWTLS